MSIRRLIASRRNGGSAVATCGILLLGSLALLPASAQVRPAAPAPPAPSATGPGEGPGGTLFVAPPAAWNERAAVRVTGVRRRVLALYYPWYGTPARRGKWIHQDGVDPVRKRIASHVHYPASGPYDSTDPVVIERHLRQAKAAGIDTLVCSWWGKDDPTDAAIRAICRQAPSQGIEVAILWERAARRSDPAAAAADLAYLVSTFAAQTTYLTEGGKPVIFVYAAICGSLKPEQWAAVMSETNHLTKNGVLLFGDVGPQPTLADLLLWDGVYHLGHTLQEAGHSPEECARLLHESARAPIFFARQAGRVSIETLAPGYDDRQLVQAQRALAPFGKTVAPPRPAATGHAGTVVDRQDGRLWKALWEQASQDKPDWVLINSFNQWHSGTEIEPSAELGDRYLTETAPLAARFRPATPRKAAVGRQ